MKKRKKDCVNDYIFYMKNRITLFMLAAFFVACSTPTISGDDSDELSSYSEKVEWNDHISSSLNMSGDDEISSSSIETLATPCKTRVEDKCEYGKITDGRDGKRYKTVKIGDQWWMAENLNYADSVRTPSLLNRSWCYGNVPKNCSKYGRLYTWAAAIDSAKLYKDESIDCGDDKTCSLPDIVQGICPSGWHLPTEMEWETLVGGRYGDAVLLKSVTGWEAYEGVVNKDVFGFAALPAGLRYNSGEFTGDGTHANFWSTSQRGTDNGAFWVGISYGDVVGVGDFNKYHALSIRCIKD